MKGKSTCDNWADRTAHMLPTALCLPVTVTPKDRPLAKAPQGDGCYGACPEVRTLISWRKQRPVALELLPPHLGPSKVQWMNSRVSIRFCSQSWPCSQFSHHLVRGEGCSRAISLSTDGRYCFRSPLSKSSQNNKVEGHNSNTQKWKRKHENY